ncbi:MAG: hypothetical protein LBB20_02060 [Puniceicoccales bacterium]|jgi:hypothetical protein|nr:hypothetical protein [Puniceicoccales bacterium]
MIKILIKGTRVIICWILLHHQAFAFELNGVIYRRVRNIEDVKNMYAVASSQSNYKDAATVLVESIREYMNNVTCDHDIDLLPYFDNKIKHRNYLYGNKIIGKLTKEMARKKFTLNQPFSYKIESSRVLLRLGEKNEKSKKAEKIEKTEKAEKNSKYQNVIKRKRRTIPWPSDL